MRVAHMQADARSAYSHAPSTKLGRISLVVLLLIVTLDSPRT
jgi:hypothetical protein